MGPSLRVGHLGPTNGQICDAGEVDVSVGENGRSQESREEVPITLVIAAENTANHWAVGHSEPGGGVQLQILL